MKDSQLFTVGLDSSCGFRRRPGVVFGIVGPDRNITQVRIVEVLDRFHVRVQRVEAEEVYRG